MIDWDRLVVESENNGVVVSAGQVALLVGADAAGVNWGNITGDVTQQADLMLLFDGFAPVDSPQFTGTPRTVTPPAGNNSTRIASTAYVQGEISDFTNTLGSMAHVDDADSDDKNYARKNETWYALGNLATKDTITESEIDHHDDIYVDATNGDDSTGTGHWTAPYKTINKALSMSSELFDTTIKIYGGTYDENLTITDKRVWLYWVSEREAPISIGNITVRNGFLRMYGNFAINKLSASYGSKVIYEEAGGNDVSNLHIKATSGTAIFADTGTFISIGGDVLLDNSGVEIVLHAKRGSVILAEGIDSAGSHWYDNVTVDTLYKADSGIVLTGGINRVQYTTAKSISSGGVAGVIGGLAYKADAPSNGNLYMRKDGDWVRYDEPTSNVLGYTSFVRRIHVFDDPDNAGVILRTWDWVELEDAPSDDHIYGRKNGAWVRIS